LLNRIHCLIAVVCTLAAGTASAQSVTISNPAPNASVASPVNIVASGSDGTTAMRLYVDDQPLTTVQGASLSNSPSLATGSHHLAVVGWNASGGSFVSDEYITVGANSSPSTGSPTPVTAAGGVGVNIAAPASGATVASPVAFSGTAFPNSGHAITAMRLYVDNQAITTATADWLSYSMPLAAGAHFIAMVAWDDTGASYKTTESITVGSASNSGGSGSGSPTPTSGSTSTRYQADFNAASQWASAQSLPSGAIMYSTQRINPYFANIAATGMVRDPKRYVQVQQWMQWYLNHLNWPDQWGLYGTTYDYNIVNGQEVSEGDADSTDSYAATFLTLAYNYYQTGDPTAQQYVRGLSYQLDAIGGVIIDTMQSDGLTWAKPNYEMKYLMDNCEVFRGLDDLAKLYAAIGDTARAQKYAGYAAKNKAGVLSMWMGSHWGIYKDWYGNNIGPNMATWYPDASSQVFPVLYQVLPASDSRAQQAYNYLNQTWPGWSQLSFMQQDAFPWVMVAAGAAQMGDTARVGQYIQNIEAKYVSKGFPWTWYNMENGWFMRLTAYENGVRPF
jgi:hypothetical protein